MHNIQICECGDTDHDDCRTAGTKTLAGAVTSSNKRKILNTLSVCHECCCLHAAEIGTCLYSGSKCLSRYGAPESRFGAGVLPGILGILLFHDASIPVSSLSKRAHQH